MIIAKKTIGEASITFTWADDTSDTVTIEDVPEALHARAILHGLSQKLGDSYSGAQGDIKAARAAFQATLTALKEGDWNRKGGGFTSGGIWVEALAQAAGVEIEEALAKWNDMPEETRKSIRKQPQVKLAKAEIEAARAKVAARDAAPLQL